MLFLGNYVSKQPIVYCYYVIPFNSRKQIFSHLYAHNDNIRNYNLQIFLPLPPFVFFFCDSKSRLWQQWQSIASFS